MSDIKAVIFDLDGTLLDTLGDLADGVNYALTQYGYPERSIDEVRHFVGNGVRNLMQQAIPEGLMSPHFEECLHTFKDYYSKNMQNKTRPYDGVLEMLDAVRDAGCKSAIVSNKFDRAVKELAKDHFGGHIEVAIGESSRTPKKPAPDCVYEALMQIGVSKEQAIYVGDSEVDVRTAHNAGIPCVAVTWGFRDRDVLVAEGADYIIDRPAELMQLIFAFRPEHT